MDPPGGGSDAGRWPLSRTGASLFWANLNKGKRSVTIDHRTPKGRELLIELVVASGADGGVFLDNMVGATSTHATRSWRDDAATSSTSTSRDAATASRPSTTRSTPRSACR